MDVNFNSLKCQKGQTILILTENNIKELKGGPIREKCTKTR